MNKKGQLFIITAPSGTGKTTIIRNILKKNIDGLSYSISHTTRKPRKGEINGLHYYFVDRATFEKMIKANEFLEWAVVYDQLYGTSLSSIDRELSSGKDLLMDVDIQGAREIKRKYPESSSIFILPPSIDSLNERLQRRSKDDKKHIELRLKNAVEEIQKCREYDYIVVNNDLKQAIKEIEAIIIAQRINRRRRFPLIQKMFRLKEM